MRVNQKGVTIKRPLREWKLNKFISIPLSFCVYLASPHILFTPRQWGYAPNVFLRKTVPSKTPAPLIKGISLLSVAVPAGLVK